MEILRRRQPDPTEPPSTSYPRRRGAYGTGKPDDPRPSERPPRRRPDPPKRDDQNGKRSMTVRAGEDLADAADRWRLRRHQPVDGRCPDCRTRGRCWTWATAFGNLVARGRLA